MPVFNHKWLFPRVQKDCWVDFSIMLVSSCNSWVLLSFPMEASSPVDVKLTDWVGRGRMEEGALPLTWRAHPLTHWDHHEEEQTSVHQRHSSVVYFSKWNSCFLVYKMWMMKLMAWDNERETPGFHHCPQWTPRVPVSSGSGQLVLPVSSQQLEAAGLLILASLMERHGFLLLQL